MVASLGMAALGTVVTWHSVEVKECDNVDFSGSTGEEIDITNHNSPDQYKEFVMGLLDGGTITCSGNKVTDTGQALVITDHYASGLWTWSVAFPDGTFAGSGYIKSFSVGAPVAGKLSWSFVIRITGKATYTP